MLSKVLAAYNIAYVLAGEPNPPTWDTKRVKIFTPGQSDAQAQLDAIAKSQGGHIPAWNGQWSDNRYALLFTPGKHDVNVDVGYYTTVHGLGKSPVDTTIGNVMAQNGDFNFTGGALANFWRGAENFQINPAEGTPMLWAVSQAAPLRRIKVNGNLQLFQYNPGNPAAGYASGGFIADMDISGHVVPGSQQQFMNRNVDMGGYDGGVWNMVFAGSTGAPESHCSNQGGNPITNEKTAPVVVEKPYIVMDGSSFKLMVPRPEFNKVGHTPGFDNADEIDFDQVYVASDSDSAALINSKLAQGLHVVMQPGQYKLEDSLKLNKSGQVLLGMGLATLIPQNGTAAVEVGNVDGVKVAGLLLQAGAQNSDALLMWGQQGYAGNSANPGAMSDVYARVGGTNATGDMRATNMVQINSGNTVVDNTWLWRADHGVGGLVENSQNPVDTGLLINGDNVTGYGLACEHTLKDMLMWNGNNGKAYFYQSEFPYDVTQAEYGDKAYSAFVVNDKVTNFEGYGLGAYSFFRDHTVEVESGIRAPSTPGVTLTNSISVFLNGKGGIKHIVDEAGSSVQSGTQTQWDCSFKGGNPEAVKFL